MVVAAAVATAVAAMVVAEAAMVTVEVGTAAGVRRTDRPLCQRVLP